MDRTRATAYSVSAGLVALLLCALAFGIGVGDTVLFVGLVAAPIVTFPVYRELRP